MKPMGARGVSCAMDHTTAGHAALPLGAVASSLDHASNPAAVRSQAWRIVAVVAWFAVCGLFVGYSAQRITSIHEPTPVNPTPWLVRR